MTCSPSQEAALAAARRSEDRAAEGRALGNLGIAYAELRRFEEAVDCFQRSLAIKRETGDRHGEGHGPEQPRQRLRGAAAV